MLGRLSGSAALLSWNSRTSRSRIATLGLGWLLIAAGTVFARQPEPPARGKATQRFVLKVPQRLSVVGGTTSVTKSSVAGEPARQQVQSIWNVSAGAAEGVTVDVTFDSLTPVGSIPSKLADSTRATPAARKIVFTSKSATTVIAPPLLPAANGQETEQFEQLFAPGRGVRVFKTLEANANTKEHSALGSVLLPQGRWETSITVDQPDDLATWQLPPVTIITTTFSAP